MTDRSPASTAAATSSRNIIQAEKPVPWWRGKAARRFFKHRLALIGMAILLVLVSIPFSFAAGYGLSWFLAHGMQSDLYRVPVVLPPSAFAFAALVTVISAVLSSLAVYWRIRQLDMIGVLKTRE